MKLFNITILTSLLTFAAVSAKAEYRPGVVNGPAYAANLRSFNVDQHHVQGPVNNGNVVLDLGNKFISLNLLFTVHCPQGAMCFVGGTFNKLNIKLPIVKISKDPCGNVIYTAALDLRRVDGMYKQLEIVDHAKSVCKIVYENIVDVSYKTAGLRPDSNGPDAFAKSYFGASALSILMHTMTTPPVMQNLQ